jgi:hypothetical protein
MSKNAGENAQIQVPEHRSRAFLTDILKNRIG